MFGRLSFASATRGASRSALDVLAHRLHMHVTQLARDIGERNVWRAHTLRDAAGYIRSVWQQQGHAVAVQHCIAYGVSCENLEVTCSGLEPADGDIVIGAHYDTVPGSPGANDNASGVAALLELGRMLRARTALRRSVRLVAFANEEEPFFSIDSMGSGEYARAARARR